MAWALLYSFRKIAPRMELYYSHIGSKCPCNPAGHVSSPLEGRSCTLYDSGLTKWYFSSKWVIFSVQLIASFLASAAEGLPVGRQIALFSCVVALTQRLRSVFVPYFRYLMDSVVAHLSGPATAALQPPKKKKKKALPETEAGISSADPLALQNQWRLRLVVSFSILSSSQAS